MGDPKKPKKKYIKPSHPWQRSRIEQEKVVRTTYGIKTKQEIWKMESMRKKFADRVKNLLATTTEQSKKEKEQVMYRLMSLGLVSQNAKLDDVLGMLLEDVMERRLQTLVWKSGLAKTPWQARQFIVHGHITVSGKIITSPSHIVSRKEESQVAFLPTSGLADSEHPERAQKKSETAKEEKTKKIKELAEAA